MTQIEEVESHLREAESLTSGWGSDDVAATVNHLVQAIRAACPREVEPQLKPPSPIGAIPTNPKDWDKEDWAILYNGIEEIRRKINERHASKTAS